MKRTVCLLAAALAACLPSASRAETWAEAINGATCIPYPAFAASNALPYSFFLYGFRQSAYCHFSVPDDWSVNDISYVLFSGTTDGGSEPMRVRLCVHSAPGFGDRLRSGAHDHAEQRRGQLGGSCPTRCRAM